MAHADTAAEVLQFQMTRQMLACLVDAAQPFGVGRQSQEGLLHHVCQPRAVGLGQAFGRQHPLVPQGQQPLQGVARVALQAEPTLGGLQSHFGVFLLVAVQRQPGGLELGTVMALRQTGQGQTAQQALRGHIGKSAMLGQQARGLQRRQIVLHQARGLEAQAQGQSAAGHALRQAGQPVQGARCIAVGQGPARGTQTRGFHSFEQAGQLTRGGQSDDILQMRFTGRPVAQGMGAFSGNQFGERPQLRQVPRQGVFVTLHRLQAGL